MEPERKAFEAIADRAMFLGASLVGSVPMEMLLESPSHQRLDPDGRRHRDGTVIVVGLAHAANRPKLDWWDNRRGRTPGNRLLIKVNRGLIKWLNKTWSIDARDLPYGPQGDGIFLKDAAVLAGLGVMGRNNLVISPRFGPYMRLRGLWVDLALPATGPLDGFAPCAGCDAPCMRACPVAAFPEGLYRRERCRLQMKQDEANRIVVASPVIGLPARRKISYCRCCELDCPVGR